MKKNNLILILIFAVLGGAAYYFLKNKNNKTSIVAADQDFAVPREKVGKIFIADRKNHQITVSLVNDEWLVQGQHKVKKDVINNCLEAISSIKVKYIPAETTHKTVISEIASHGIKVEVYGKNNDKLKTFYIGSNDNEGSGTYCILENATKPYVMHIPFTYAELQPRFPLLLDDWRDRTIFATRVEDIVSASVEYPEQKSLSFKIDAVNNFALTPFYAGVPPLPTAPQKGKVQQYLLGFEKAVAEAIENGNPVRDSIIQLQPFSIVTMKNKKGEEMALRIYPKISKEKADPDLRTKTPDRYYAFSNKGDFYLIQDGVFRKFFWEYKAFF
jgi:Domain of unknown function (DUF4340)